MGKIMGHGFDSDVCEGCPYHEFVPSEDPDKSLTEKVANIFAGDEEGYWSCGHCGCPTAEGLLLDRFQAVPEECPPERKAEHKRRSQ